MTKKAKIDLTVFGAIGTRAMQDKDAAASKASARRAELRTAILGAFPKAIKAMDKKSDELAPLQAAFVQAARVAWCSVAREDKAGSFDMAAVRAALDLDGKAVKALPERVKAGRSAAFNNARVAWFEDIAGAMPEWIVREEKAKALKEAAESSPAAEEEAEAEPVLLTADSIRAQVRLLAATLPSAEAAAFLLALNADVQGFTRSIKAGARIERIVKVA
jgi:hypothetical protein